MGVSKSLDKCIGCEVIRLVNRIGLCKRCNKHALDFVSEAELAKAKEEHDAELAAEHVMKETEAAKKAEKAETAGEGGEGAEGAGEGAPEGEGKAEGKEGEKEGAGEGKKEGKEKKPAE